MPSVGIVDDGSGLGAVGGSAIDSVTAPRCRGAAASTFCCTGEMYGAAATVTRVGSADVGGATICTRITQAANSRTAATGKAMAPATIETQKRAPARSIRSASDPIHPASHCDIS